ncbi:MAG: S8 family serine peptidase [Fimbriimonas sp.]
MRQRIRIAAAASVLALTALAPAESIVARIGRGAVASEIAQRHGVSLLGVTPDGRYARFGVPASADPLPKLARLRADKGLASADFDARLQTVSISRTSPTMVQKGSTIPVVGDRYALKVANADLLGLINWNESLALAPGRNLRVALLDTGLADSAVSLWSKTVASQNFVEAGALPLDQPTGIDSNENGVADEAVGHGTVVAGIVDLIAPRTQFIVARIANSDGYATSWSLLNGIQFAIANGAEVINISLAEKKKVAAVEEALADAERRGIVVVGSVGNDNEDKVYEPAHVPSVIAVSAVNVDATKAPFSNYEKGALVAAPGTSLIGRDWTSDEVQWAGTSFSAAFVSGTIADVLRRRPPAKPRDVRAALTASGRNIDPQNPAYKGKLGRLIDAQALSARLGGG